MHQRETEYPPDGPRSCGTQYQADSQMKPFDIKNKDGLSNSYHSLYTYAPSPTCDNGLCRGDYLFCNTNTGFCSAKVRPGGDCSNLEQFDSCFNSACIGGRCSSGQSGASSNAGQGQSAVVADDAIATAATTPATAADSAGITAAADDPSTTAAANVGVGVVTAGAVTEQLDGQDTAQQPDEQPDTLLAMTNADSIATASLQ